MKNRFHLFSFLAIGLGGVIAPGYASNAPHKTTEPAPLLQLVKNIYELHRETKKTRLKDVLQLRSEQKAKLDTKTAGLWQAKSVYVTLKDGRIYDPYRSGKVASLGNLATLGADENVVISYDALEKAHDTVMFDEMIIEQSLYGDELVPDETAPPLWEQYLAKALDIPVPSSYKSSFLPLGGCIIAGGGVVALLGLVRWLLYRKKKRNLRQEALPTSPVEEVIALQSIKEL